MRRISEWKSSWSSCRARLSVWRPWKDSLSADNSDTLLTLRDIYETHTPFDGAQNRSSLGSFVKLRLRPQLMTTDGTKQMERDGCVFKDVRQLICPSAVCGCIFLSAMRPHSCLSACADSFIRLKGLAKIVVPPLRRGIFLSSCRQRTYVYTGGPNSWPLNSAHISHKSSPEADGSNAKLRVQPRLQSVVDHVGVTESGGIQKDEPR